MLRMLNQPMVKPFFLPKKGKPNNRKRHIMMFSH